MSVSRLLDNLFYIWYNVIEWGRRLKNKIIPRKKDGSMLRIILFVCALIEMSNGDYEAASTLLIWVCIIWLFSD